jgi:uncharacterized membrane protein YphA (DoxX/SURF4 family)
MNVVLWILQVLLGLAFVFSGSIKVFRYEQAKKQMSFVSHVSRNLVTFIGIAEVLGGLGLILPPLTGTLMWLTPLAGAGLALVMLLAVAFHVQRSDGQIAPSAVLFVLTAFVAYGRWVVAPF